MKRKNALNASVIGLSIFALAGLTPVLSASAQTTGISFDDAQDAKAIEIIEKSIEASGGRELLSSVKHVKQTGTISVPMAGLSGTIESYARTPGQWLLVVNLPGIGEQRQGLNDGIAWSSDVMSGPRILPEEEARPMKEEADLTNRLKFKEKHPTISYMGEVDFDETKAHKIKLIDEHGDESIEYFSVERGLVIGTEATVPSAMGLVKTTTFLREYKEVGGILQPTKVVQKVGPQEVIIEIKTTSYDKIDDSVFELPEAVKALAKVQKQDD